MLLVEVWREGKGFYRGLFLAAAASFCAAFVFAPFVASAANLGELDSVEHGGVTIVSNETIARSNLLNTSKSWTFNFNWPNSVSSGNSFLAVFRGEFGNLEGGAANEGVNWAANFQSFQAGANSKSKSINIPALGEVDTGSYMYTAFMAERAAGVSHLDTAEWFASGGVSGVEPVNYQTLTFEYDGSFDPQNLEGAIEEISHGGRTILEGETVLKKEVTTDSDLWRWKFTWPNAVDNQRALFVVFRGEFGDLEGGDQVEGVNWAQNLQVFPAGTSDISKRINIPTLAGGATDSIYTLAVMERDPKYLDGGLDQQIEWFASGGVEGIPPLKYATLSFEFREFAECCSNIAFIPGIKASELWEGDDKVWLPTLFSNDVASLQMDEVGESIKSVTTGSVIGKAYNYLEIYQDFLSFLSGLSAEKGIEASNLPYDWRYDVFDVVSNDQAIKDGGVLNFSQKIHSLAESSDTGKVTIIAHSNGGLVAKALTNELGSDATNLIDKIIFVGTPQLGTPSAIGALLHGQNQALPVAAAPFSLTMATARELMNNMPGAYGLLPLSSYFDRGPSPVIEFDDSELTGLFRNAYGQTIDSSSELLSFLLGSGDGRSNPEREDIRTPSILNNLLLTDALSQRENLESWDPPEGIDVYEVVGEGLQTVSGQRYYERCVPRFLGGEECFLDTMPLFTNEGDSTVVSLSGGVINGAERYFANLYAYNEGNNTNWKHANMVANHSIQQLIENIITNADDVPLYIRSSEQPLNTNRSLRISVHSPASIEIKDQNGRTTGLIDNPDSSANFPVVLEEIPNSFYLEFGEGKYAGVPVGGEREIILTGTGDGFFTLEVVEIYDGDVVGEKIFSNVPVIESLKASLKIQDIESVGDLEIDEDGDGTVDTLLKPDGYEPTLSELIDTLDSEIEGLGTFKGIKRVLLNRAKQIRKAIEKEQLRKAQRIIYSMEWYIRNLRGWLIKNDDADVLIDILNDIRMVIQ